MITEIMKLGGKNPKPEKILNTKGYPILYIIILSLYVSLMHFKPDKVDGTNT